MRVRSILAVETSTNSAGAALRLEDGTVLEERLEAGGVQGKALAPCLRDLLAAAGLAPEQVDLVAVGLGPGSYTGLRVGIALARAFAFAAGCPVVGVSSFEALALQQAEAGDGEILIVAPAGMDEYYHGLYAVTDGRVKELRAPQIASAADLRVLAAGKKIRGEGALRLLRGRDEPGPGGADPKGKAEDLDPASADALAELPSARSVALLGHRVYLEEGPTPEEKLVPLYLRRSKAEIQWEKRRNHPEA